MRLSTHNHLMCPKKNCHAFPLHLAISRMEADEPNEESLPYEYILHILPTIDYNILRTIAVECKLATADDLPENLPSLEELHTQIIAIKRLNMTDDDNENDELNDEQSQVINLFMTLNRLLNEIHVETGELICEKCTRHYPIQNGIPNLRLNEDEV